MVPVQGIIRQLAGLVRPVTHGRGWANPCGARAADRCSPISFFVAKFWRKTFFWRRGAVKSLADRLASAPPSPSSTGFFFEKRVLARAWSRHGVGDRLGMVQITDIVDVSHSATSQEAAESGSGSADGAIICRSACVVCGAVFWYGRKAGPGRWRRFCSAACHQQRHKLQLRIYAAAARRAARGPDLFDLFDPLEGSP